jgi:prepilin-type N-terminal cleavage/methylation domain-containing protein
MNNFIIKFIPKPTSIIRNAKGFTLPEIIMSIVIIGISVPAIMVPFTSLKYTQSPEVVVQASFLAQKHMETLADKNVASIDTECSSLNGADGAFTLTCSTIDVAAADLDTALGSAGFAKKVTLGINHPEMEELSFVNLFTQ